MTQPGIGRGPLHTPSTRWAALLCLGLGACASEPSSDPSPPAAEALAPAPTPRTGRPTFSTDGLADAAPCTPASPPTEPLPSVSLRLFHGPGATTQDTDMVGETIRAVWARLGLDVQLTAPEPLSTSTPDQLFDAAAQTEADQLAPLRSVLAAVPEGPSIAVIVMARFVDPSSPLSAFRGLTVPVRGSDEAAASSSTAFVESNPHPRPVVFVNLAAGPRAPGDLSLSPAHEVGHALGLAHRPEDTALMSAGDLSLRCLPGLTAQEWKTLATAVERMPTIP